MANETILVSGATSIIGEFLLARLQKTESTIIAISRQLHPSSNNTDRLYWHAHPRKLQNVDVSILIHLAPIWVLPDILTTLAPGSVHRLIVFSSTSRYTKVSSSSTYEQAIANKLIASEAWMEQWCQENAVHWTMFRPTMIYAPGRDHNVTTIDAFIRRWGFFPLVGPGAGLRQPVYADDLAKACLNVLHRRETFNKSYNLGGGEILTFRELLTEIAGAHDKSLRILRLPFSLFSALIKPARLLPGLRHINAEMLKRTEQNLVFDTTDAVKDFGYAPRPFRPLRDIGETEESYRLSSRYR